MSFTNWFKFRSVLVLLLAALMILPAGRLAVSPAPVKAQDLPTDPVEIEVWWWGETEAPGSEAWVQSAQEAYSAEHPNVTFVNNLLSVDALLPSYEAAGQAKEGP